VTKQLEWTHNLSALTSRRKPSRARTAADVETTPRPISCRSHAAGRRCFTSRAKADERGEANRQQQKGGMFEIGSAGDGARLTGIEGSPTAISPDRQKSPNL